MTHPHVAHVHFHHPHHAKSDTHRNHDDSALHSAPETFTATVLRRYYIHRLWKRHAALINVHRITSTTLDLDTSLGINRRATARSRECVLGSELIPEVSPSVSVLMRLWAFLPFASL
jgi:hypothetical protein